MGNQKPQDNSINNNYRQLPTIDYDQVIDIFFEFCNTILEFI